MEKMGEIGEMGELEENSEEPCIFCEIVAEKSALS